MIDALVCQHRISVFRNARINQHGVASLASTSAFFTLGGPALPGVDDALPIFHAGGCPSTSAATEASRILHTA